VSEVQEEGTDDPVRSVQGDGWFGRSIALPVPERMQSARVALPDARQELLIETKRGYICLGFRAPEGVGLLQDAITPPTQRGTWRGLARISSSSVPPGRQLRERDVRAGVRRLHHGASH
jgi:hypothetical protein